MRILNETYLDQMCEELEILDFELDRLWEAATGTSVNESYEEDSLDGISLLEDVESETQILNEEAYDLYVESLTDSLKKIWAAIVRFVKSIFTSTGKTLTTSDIQKTVEIISSASAEGVEKGSVKKVIQNGFYIIAGLGTSVDGVKLREAYDSGDIMNFVYQNIRKVKVGSLPADARFRICIGTYTDAAKVNSKTIETTIRTLIKGGVDAVKAMGKKDISKVKGAFKKESFEDDEFDFDEMFESTRRYTLSDVPEPLRSNPKIIKMINDARNLKGGDAEEADDRIYEYVKGLVKQTGIGKKTPLMLTDGKPARQPKKEYEPSESEKIAYHAGETGGYDKGKRAAAAEAGETLKKVHSYYDGEINSYINHLTNLNGEVAKLKEENKLALAKALADGKIREDKIRAASKAELDRKANIMLAGGFIAGAAATGVVGSASVLLAYGIGALIDHCRGPRSKDGSALLSLATITYVNESQPNAIAKVRLYTRNSVTNLDVNGRDKVYALRDDLTSIAKEMEMVGDKLSPGMKEKVREFAMNINLFFSGMVEKSSSK